MQAVELSAFGLEHLARVERKDPVPGAGQVLVRMRFASLNYRDQVVVAGGYGAQNPIPLIPLSDGAGEVVAVGDGVRRFSVGDRVMTCFFQGWSAGAPTADRLATSLGGPLDGTLCELMCLSEHGLCRLSDEVSLMEAV